jgi:hypothetical protein
VYFLDEGTYPETDAFWIRGARRAQVVIDREQQSPTSSLFIRNGPVENTLTIEAGRWRNQLTLAPSEERVVAVPSSPSGSSTLLRFATTSGFRPSQVVSSSRDHRFLGVWVRLAD